tara:strand:- start:743 stop:4372 length:3630 start_codon:yes stop_codon:yes gene_type:complete
MPLLGESNPRQGFAGVSSGFTIPNTAMLSDGDSERFVRTFDITPSNQKKFTISGWYKRVSDDKYDIFFGTQTGATAGRVQAYTHANGRIVYEMYHGSGWNSIITDRVFRDTHAWYNLMFVMDIQNPVQADRMRIYVNGERASIDTSGAGAITHAYISNTALNHLMFSNSYEMEIGDSGDNNMYDGHMSEIIGLDGRALTSMSPFGENNDSSVWIPKDPTDELAVSTTAESIINTTSAVDSVQRTTYTFSSVALGTASTTRAVYVWSTAQGPSVSAFNINTMTVGGISASLVQVADSSAEPQYMGELWRADVPTGTTGDIVVTWNSAVSQCGVSVWSVDGDHEEFAIATDVSNSTSSVSFTNVPDNSVILAGRGSSFSGTHTWTGDVTENVDQEIDGSVRHSAASQFHATGGSKSVTCTPDGGTTDSRARLVAIVLSPKQGTGRNGFYMPFTQSTFLGADYATTATQTTFNSASDWTGTTGAYTFTQGSIEAGTADKAVKSVQTFAGDFEFQWRYVDKANWMIGVYDTAEDGTFNDSNSSGGMSSMTDSFYVQASSVAGNNDIRYGSATVVDSTTISNGDTWKIGRVGSQIKVYRNGSVVHTFSQTNSDTMRIVFAQGDTSADADNISWVDGTGTVGKNFFAIGSPTQSGDTPTENYAVMSSLHSNAAEFAEGGTTAVTDGTDGAQLTGSIAFDSQDSDGYYFVVRPTTTSSTIGAFSVGVATVDHANETPTNDATNAGSWFLSCGSGGITNTSGISNGTWDSQSNGGGSLNDYFQIAVKAGKIYFGKNNTWYDSSDNTFANAGEAFSNLTGMVVPMVQHAHASAGTFQVEFGAFGYTHAKPSGFKDINTTNLKASNPPAIEDGSKYFNTVLYTANNSDDHAITGVGFKPDWVWIKDRDTVASHAAFDAVRGVSGGNGFIVPNTTDSQGQGGQTNTLKSLDSDGFTLDDDSNDQRVNFGGEMVSWNWLAGNLSDGSGTSNGDGSVTSTISVNTTAGFSICKFSPGGNVNMTFGHGLGVAPRMVIVKNLDDGATNWQVLHLDVGVGNKIFLNTDAAKAADANMWQNTAPSTTVVSMGTAQTTAENFIAYCFAAVPGYSAFGSYEGGANSADGRLVRLDFSPAWLMIKNIDNAGESWYIFDDKRPGYNQENYQLIANTTAVEGSGDILDLLSNGFKIRANDRAYGGTSSTDTYIYMAFAKNPFAGSAPATAR